MKKLTIILIVFLFSGGFQIFAQDLVNLPKPEKEGGKALMEALNERQSSRAYADKELSKQQLSNLLWSAFGINRPESGKRTAPTSRDVRDIEVYAVMKSGAFLYLPEQNALKKIVDKDIRNVTGKQGFVKNAALNLVYVSDFSKYDSDNEQALKMTAGTHCGFIGQNVYLYCASEGLNTVFRAWIDNDLIHKKLNLPEHKHVIYSQSVGFPK
jgi:SagB-type dehydrogenase family enzyme